MGSDDFCGGYSFWNGTLLIRSEYPKFTPCFINLGLFVIPCGVLWLITPYYWHHMKKIQDPGNVKFGAHNIIKMILSVCTMAAAIALLVHHVTDDADIFPAVYLADGVRIATYCLTLLLIQLERHYGLINSVIMFLFWMISTICYVVPFYTNLKEQVSETDALQFALDTVLLGASGLQFLAFCFAEKAHNQEKSKLRSLETTASIPSRLTYWWDNDLIYKGFRKTLTEEDVNDLPTKDRSANQVPNFERAWAREVKKCEEYNERWRSRHPELTDSQYARMRRQGKTLGESQPGNFGKRNGKPDNNGKKNAKEPDEKTSLLPKTSQKEQKTKPPLKTPSLAKVLVLTHGVELSILVVTQILVSLVSFVPPKITEGLLNYINEADESNKERWVGYVLASSYFIINMFTSIASLQLSLATSRLGMHMKTSLVAAVYKKALSVTNEARKSATAGEIVNLMSIDCNRVEMAMGMISSISGLPIQLAVSIYMLFEQLGIAVLAGIGVVILIMPFNTLNARILRKYNRLVMECKDKRIRLMTEILAGMKVLKLYAWEIPFSNKINVLRNTEMKLILRQAIFMACLNLLFGLVPALVQVASFGVFIAMDGYLNPSKAFVSISLLQQLMMSMNQLPFVLPMVIQAAVSVGRINRFLSFDDIPANIVKKDPNSDAAIKIKDGTFTWDKEQPLPTLRNINMTIDEGSLVAVVGTVGCGKSSLLSAMLGEMTKLDGTVTVKSGIAYVPQEAWIQNATLRDNILFGTEYKESTYNRVIDACALKQDLEILPGGDQTEIGEKGINISGGQKQRVSLARAVYSKADIYLLDDPLSAVDSHVGKHIFTKVVGHKGVLRGKTRVLVTHGVYWLPLVDRIIVLKDGSIAESGTFEELLKHDGDFAQFLKEYFIKEAVSEDEDSGEEFSSMKQQILKPLENVSGFKLEDELAKLSMSGSYHFSRSMSHSASHRRKSKPDIKPAPIKDGADLKRGQKLIEAEKQEQGNIKASVFISYIKAVGPLVILLGVALFVLSMGSSVFNSIWLSLWTDDEYLANRSLSDTSEYTSKSNLYLSIFALSGILQGVFSFLSSATVLYQGCKAAKKMHNAMLVNILRAPMSFFDTTPIGRIVNRFSRDVDVIDISLPSVMRSSIISCGRVIQSLVTIAYSIPIIMVVILPVMVLYILLQRFFMPASRQLRRIDSTTRSPIYAHFSESLSGVTSIRGYGVQNRFMAQSERLVDANFKFYFANITTNQWLNLRLQLLGNIIVLAAAMFAVSTSGLTAGLAGLSVSYAMRITGSLSFFIQIANQAETNIVSAERVLEYAQNEVEADWDRPDNKPPPEWPQAGETIFDDLHLRYRPGLELVLKGVSCQLKPGEKIGIVGRTGAGKSSLTVALFRLVEAASGKIIIDDRLTSELGLHDLRSKITILPQDPVIFWGDIRMNLDPAEQYSDDELWEALEHAHLKGFVAGLADGLNYNCGENGSNLSMGQRQLLCLARTLLRKTRVLVLDEATAAVDMETDELIQNTIRTEFKSSTVLTIAHRLNTIMDYDRILVMDKGMVAELDSPSNLLANPDSIFYGMAKEANLV